METDPPLIWLDQHAVGDPVARRGLLLKVVSWRQTLRAKAGDPQCLVDGNGLRRDRWLKTVDARFRPIALPDVDLTNRPLAE